MRWVRSWDVPSDSSDRLYKVSQAESGAFGCSCPAWTFRGRRGGQRTDCKHIARLKVALAGERMTASAIPASSTPPAGAAVANITRPRLSEVIGTAPACPAGPVLEGALEQLLDSFLKGEKA
ncbi:MAG: hypothetical protein U0166_00505 [Acidobacteriota bacterium]